MKDGIKRRGFLAGLFAIPAVAKVLGNAPEAKPLPVQPVAAAETYLDYARASSMTVCFSMEADGNVIRHKWGIK